MDTSCYGRLSGGLNLGLQKHSLPCSYTVRTRVLVWRFLLGHNLENLFKLCHVSLWNGGVLSRTTKNTDI